MLPYAIEREPHELLPAMPPSVACAEVLTSTGNQSPCGCSHAFSASSTTPGSTVDRQRLAIERDHRGQVLAVVDDERRADRLAALRAAGAARQHRHAEFARRRRPPRARRRAIVGTSTPIGST